MHKRVLSVEETLPTIDTGNRYSLVQPSVLFIDADAIDIDEKADPWKTLVRKLLRYKENVICFGRRWLKCFCLRSNRPTEIWYRMFVTPEPAALGFKRTHIFHARISAETDRQRVTLTGDGITYDTCSCERKC